MISQHLRQEAKVGPVSTLTVNESEQVTFAGVSFIKQSSRI